MREREREKLACKDASLLGFLPIRLATGEQFVAPGNHRRGAAAINCTIVQSYTPTENSATGVATNTARVSGSSQCPHSFSFGALMEAEMKQKFITYFLQTRRFLSVTV